MIDEPTTTVIDEPVTSTPEAEPEPEPEPQYEDAKTRVLEAALAFCTMLIADGENVHENGGGAHLNLVIIEKLDQVDATKGHPDKLQARALDIQQALTDYRASMATSAAL